MKNRKTLVVVCLMVLAALALTACGTATPFVGKPLEETGQVYGFFYGFWDGITAILAFIGNLLGGHFGIYQIHNDGNWYDLGFLLGVGAFTKGATSAASFKLKVTSY